MTGKFKRELARRPYRVFLGALAVMLAHLLEDALVHKENGSSLAAQLGEQLVRKSVLPQRSIGQVDRRRRGHDAFSAPLVRRAFSTSWP